MTGSGCTVSRGSPARRKIGARKQVSAFAIGGLRTQKIYHLRVPACGNRGGAGKLTVVLISRQYHIVHTVCISSLRTL